MTKIAISAAEVSGDTHGAFLASELKALEPSLFLIGMGGEKMKAAGVGIRVDVTEKSTIGIIEAFRHLPSQLFAYYRMVRLLKKEKPSAIVLIDAQGFNLPLAKAAKKLGIKTIYYISPHYWLWGIEKGLKEVAGALDKIIAVFEEAASLYLKAGASVSYFGHPLVDIVKPTMSKEGFLKKFELDPLTKIIGIFPGSRLQEIKALLPLQLRAGEIIDSSIGGAQFLLALASPKLKKDVVRILKKTKIAVKIVEGMNYDVLNISDAAIASGGSTTLEAALLNTPVVMFYKLSRLTEFIILKVMKISVPFYSLPSLLEGREVIPELVQKEATAENLAEETISLLVDEKRVPKMKEDFASIRKKLGAPGVVKKVAETILKAAKAPLLS